MYFTDDPVADAERHMRALDAQLEKHPRCAECGHHIQDDECYEINEQLICPKCLNRNYKRWTDDYIQD